MHGQEHGSWAHVPYEKNIVAQHGGHNPANTLTQACTFILDIFDIGHPYYGMLWSIDTCQNKVSADQYHATISWAQV